MGTAYEISSSIEVMASWGTRWDISWSHSALLSVYMCIQYMYVSTRYMYMYMYIHVVQSFTVPGGSSLQLHTTVGVHYGKYCTRAWSRANKARGAAECFICLRPRPECYNIILIHVHERERYFNWFIVAALLASAALNDLKWAIRSKLPPTMLTRSRGMTGEPL